MSPVDMELPEFSSGLEGLRHAPNDPKGQREHAIRVLLLTL